MTIFIIILFVVFLIATKAQKPKGGLLFVLEIYKMPNHNIILITGAHEGESQYRTFEYHYTGRHRGHMFCAKTKKAVTSEMKQEYIADIKSYLNFCRGEKNRQSQLMFEKYFK